MRNTIKIFNKFYSLVFNWLSRPMALRIISSVARVKKVGQNCPKGCGYSDRFVDFFSMLWQLSCGNQFIYKHPLEMKIGDRYSQVRLRATGQQLRMTEAECMRSQELNRKILRPSAIKTCDNGQEQIASDGGMEESNRFLTGSSLPWHLHMVSCYS